MSNAIIKVDNLSKRYHLGELHQRTNSFRDRITSLLKRDSRIKEFETIWALKNVSFEVKEGEIIGIIGRNGAGKSTLLKILSRITKPTKGKAFINGRVSSLLEVGTGFHPELTGGENIFLNGSILGMRKREINKKFDEIVSFAEIEKFLDTPVKRYSSGMYVRLAFAVAAHLDPEVLLVDEVLAVGDVAFQKKCLGKMGDVSKEGRTVLFVSHNMGAISQLCQKALLLDQGQKIAQGVSAEVIKKYLSDKNVNSEMVDLSNWKVRTGSGVAIFKSVSILNSGGEIADKFFIGDSLRVCFEIETQKKINEIRIAVGVRDSMGSNIFLAADVDGNFRFDSPKKVEELEIEFQNLRLYPDTYYVTLWMADLSYQAFDKVEDCIKFDILNGGPLVMRPLPRAQGVIFTSPIWTRK